MSVRRVKNSHGNLETVKTIHKHINITHIMHLFSEMRKIIIATTTVTK